MDELSPNSTNTKEITCAKNMRLFLDLYYKQISNLITIKAFDNRLYIVSIYTRIMDVIYHALSQVTYIQQFKTQFCIHAIKIIPFDFKSTVKNTDNVCHIINNINNLFIKSAKHKIKNFNKETTELISIGDILYLPDDLVGVIGDFIEYQFSKDYYKYLDYIVDGNLSLDNSIKLLKENFDS